MTQDRYRFGQHSHSAPTDDGVILAADAPVRPNADGGFDVTNAQSMTINAALMQNLAACKLKVWLQAPSGNWFEPPGSPIAVGQKTYTDHVVLGRAYQRAFVGAFAPTYDSDPGVGGVSLEMVVVY